MLAVAPGGWFESACSIKVAVLRSNFRQFTAERATFFALRRVQSNQKF